MTHDCSAPTVQAGTYVFDARGVARRFRHAAIFGALEALMAGETMRFYNDHDPIPLIRQLMEHFSHRLDIVYRAHDVDKVVIDFKVMA